MHDFGDVDLTGKTVMVREFLGVKVKRPPKERQFFCKSGPGCSSAFKLRKITGHWICDKIKDDINSYDIESYLDGETWRKSHVPSSESDSSPVLLSPQDTPSKKAPKQKRGPDVPGVPEVRVRVKRGVRRKSQG